MNTQLNQQAVQASKRLSISICARAGVPGSRADNRARSPTGEHSSAGRGGGCSVATISCTCAKVPPKSWETQRSGSESVVSI